MKPSANPVYERLRRWLDEWQLDQALGRETASEEAFSHGSGDAAPTLLPGAPLEVEAEPAAGQIRLLAPELTGHEAPPVWIAILDRRADGAGLTAPFSRFSEPALPGELALPRTSAPLRVLCLWNAWWWQPAAVAQSWVVETLTPAELEDALVVWSWENRAADATSLSGDALPPALAARVGPPLIHPDDPRVTYRYQTMLAMERWERAAASLYLQTGNPAQWLRAAERDQLDVPPDDEVSKAPREDPS